MFSHHLLRPLASIGLLLTLGLGVATELAGQDTRTASGESSVTIRLDGERSPRAEEQRFIVTGLPQSTLRRLSAVGADNSEAWHATMSVTVVTDAESPNTEAADAGPAAARVAARPMLGDYFVEEGAVVFVPRYPLRRGTTYRVAVITKNAEQALTLVREFSLAAAPKQPATRIVAVFPTASLLPENQLKFYLHFSSPMSRGEAYDRVKLLDDQGDEVDFPFLELGEELWDPAGTRFTLFFDPGRIKRGLKPRELFGPSLIEGRSYTLVVDRAWRDARGQPLHAAHYKRFKVAAPDDVQPAPSNWQIVAPAAESRQPLVVSFGEPLDHAMLQRVLTVQQGKDTVPGKMVISKQESQWSFQPADDWAAGEYSLVVDAALEDLAGNSIGQPFEVDVFNQVDRVSTPAAVPIPFVIR